jgi:hypothetical protein
MPEFATAQDALGYVTDQTYRINATVYAAQYPELNYAELVPVNSEGPEWSSGVITYMTDSAGKADWFSGKAKDMRLAEVIRGKTDTTFGMAGIGYEFDLEEVNRAALVGQPLTNQKADAALRGANEFIYSAALVGDAAKGFKGLFNSTIPTQGLVANNAGATSRLWANKTPDEILADVNTLLTGIYTGSATVEMADTLLLPIERLLYISQRRLDATSDQTILSFLQRTNSYTVVTGRPLMIRGVRELLTAGAGGTARMVGYRRDPGVLEYYLPMPHRFLPVWQNGPINFLIPGIFRLGALDIRRPGAIRYADGF